MEKFVFPNIIFWNSVDPDKTEIWSWSALVSNMMFDSRKSALEINFFCW